MTHSAWYHWMYCWYWYTFFQNLMNCIQHFMVSIEFIWSDRILNNSFHLTPEMTPTKANHLCWICEKLQHYKALQGGIFTLYEDHVTNHAFLLQSQFIVWFLCWTFGSSTSTLLLSFLVGQFCLISCGWSRDKFVIEIQYSWHGRQSKTSKIHGVMNKATNLYEEEETNKCFFYISQRDKYQIHIIQHSGHRLTIGTVDA